MNTQQSLFTMLATGISSTLPFLIICATGLTFALMCLQNHPRAKRLAIIGCVLGLVAPFFTVVVQRSMVAPYNDYWMVSSTKLLPALANLLMSACYIGAAVFWFLAALADRPSADSIEHREP